MFVVQPASQNVTESTDNVVFNCTAYSLGSHWYVQDGLADSNINIARGITESSVIIDDDQNLKIHLLYLPALLTNDNLTITCYIYTSNTVPSEPVLLRIQGLKSYFNSVFIINLFFEIRITKSCHKFASSMDKCFVNADNILSS